jgi:predicted membrane metal-binding protein
MVISGLHIGLIGAIVYFIVLKGLRCLRVCQPLLRELPL